MPKFKVGDRVAIKPSEYNLFICDDAVVTEVSRKCPSRQIDLEGKLVGAVVSIDLYHTTPCAVELLGLTEEQQYEICWDETELFHRPDPDIITEELTEKIKDISYDQKVYD